MKQAQEMRAGQAIGMDCFLGDASEGIVTKAREQGLAFQEKTKVKGHGPGSPLVWVLGGVLETIVNTDKEAGRKGEAEGCLSASLKHYSELDPDDKAEVFRHFKVTKTYKSDQARTTLSTAPDSETLKLRSALIQALARRSSRRRAVPASPMERDLLTWIGSLS